MEWILVKEQPPKKFVDVLCLQHLLGQSFWM